MFQASILLKEKGRPRPSTFKFGRAALNASDTAEGLVEISQFAGVESPGSRRKERVVDNRANRRNRWPKIGNACKSLIDSAIAPIGQY